MLPKLEQEYLDKFGKYFPLRQFRNFTDEEIDNMIKECLEKGEVMKVPEELRDI